MSASETPRVGRDTHKVVEDDKVSDTLVHVFGLKLPNDIYSQSARSSNELAQALKDYAAAIEKARRSAIKVKHAAEDLSRVG